MSVSSTIRVTSFRGKFFSVAAPLLSTPMQIPYFDVRC
jgi:hypothetical protein